MKRLTEAEDAMHETIAHNDCSLDMSVKMLMFVSYLHTVKINR